MIIETPVTLDVCQANLFNPIIIAEDDENSHVILAQIEVNGEVLHIPTTGVYSVKLNYRRADGTKAVVAGTISSNKVRVELPDEMLELDDLVVCDIVINYRISKTTHALSVSGGKIVVTPSTHVYDAPLRTALFYIDSQLRVITGG